MVVQTVTGDILEVIRYTNNSAQLAITLSQMLKLRSRSLGFVPATYTRKVWTALQKEDLQ